MRRKDCKQGKLVQHIRNDNTHSFRKLLNPQIDRTEIDIVTENICRYGRHTIFNYFNRNHNVNYDCFFNSIVKLASNNVNKNQVKILKKNIKTNKMTDKHILTLLKLCIENDRFDLIKPVFKSTNTMKIVSKVSRSDRYNIFKLAVDNNCVQIVKYLIDTRFITVNNFTKDQLMNLIKAAVNAGVPMFKQIYLAELSNYYINKSLEIAATAKKYDIVKFILMKSIGNRFLYKSQTKLLKKY